MDKLKCNMCGGIIIFEKGTDFGICDSCGTRHNLNLSVEEKSKIIQKEQQISYYLDSLSNQEKEINERMNEIDKMESRKKNVLISTILSFLSFLSFVFMGSELPEWTMDIFVPSAFILSIIGYVFLQKNTKIIHLKNQKPDSTINKFLAILGYFIQLFTGSLFGVVAGVIYYFKFINLQKQNIQLKDELLVQLKNIENEKENIIKYSDYKR